VDWYYYIGPFINNRNKKPKRSHNGDQKKSPQKYPIKNLGYEFPVFNNLLQKIK
jgi:hypothetical protein